MGTTIRLTATSSSGSYTLPAARSLGKTELANGFSLGASQPVQSLPIDYFYGNPTLCEALKSYMDLTYIIADIKPLDLNMYIRLNSNYIDALKEWNWRNPVDAFFAGVIGSGGVVDVLGNNAGGAGVKFGTPTVVSYVDVTFSAGPTGGNTEMTLLNNTTGVSATFTISDTTGAAGTESCALYNAIAAQIGICFAPNDEVILYASSLVGGGNDAADIQFRLR